MSTACPRVLVASVDEVAVEFTYVWHERPVPTGLEVRQVYGYLLCPQTARVLIQDVGGGKFNLPGGTPELYDADITATLVREAMEESQVLVTTVVYLGYQEVRRDAEPPFAQVRMAGLIARFGPRAPDPDGGRLFRRYMASLDDAPAVLGWGEPAVAQAAAAARVATRLWGLPVAAASPAGYADLSGRMMANGAHERDDASGAATVRVVCGECGSADPKKTRLIVIRGNSASGKSTIASLIRDKHGRGIALVGQDNLRRVILREHDTAGAANIGLIDLTCRFALANGYHIVLEGILRAERYGEMLTGLRAEYTDRSSWWFLDVAFGETLKRHDTKPQAGEYGEAAMRSWWLEQDFLPGRFEQVITADESAEAAATRIMTGAGLIGDP